MTTKTKEELEQSNKLTLREHISMILLCMMFKILSPTGWHHEIEEPLKEIRALLNKAAK